MSVYSAVITDQTYEGIGIYMNGGSFGAVGSVYKGNYFAGITTSAGVHAGTASARPNDYDVFIVAGGVAAKTGYNLEIKKGSVIVQPSLGISYTFVNSLITIRQSEKFVLTR